MTVRVRAVTVGDSDALCALEEQLFGRDAWSAVTVADEVAGSAEGRRHVAVAVDAGGGLLGYADTQVAGDLADLHRIGVHPGGRRRGTASELLRDAVAHARGAGAVRMLLEVSARNAAARAFYAARGFEEIDRRQRYYRDGSDALVLQCELEETR